MWVSLSGYFRAGEMTNECLLLKYENPSSIPGTHVKMPGIVLHFFLLRKQEQDDPW